MEAVLYAINWVLRIFEFVLIARVLISWLPVSRDNKAIDLLYSITEPVLAPIRRMLSQSRFLSNSAFGMIDFSPIVAFLLIGVIRNIIARIYMTLIF